MSTTNPTAAAALSFATETEIYITADGQVIIADLPVELAGLLACGPAEPCQINEPGTPPAMQSEFVEDSSALGDKEQRLKGEA